MNQSKLLFKMEEKVDIKFYHGKIDTLKLNYQLYQLEVYFNNHQVEEESKNSFEWLELEVHALTEWESHMETLRLEGEPPVTKWEDFETIIKSLFYPIGYIEEQWIQWHYFKKMPCQSMQEYTTKFRNMAIILVLSPNNPYVLLNYLGGLQWHL